MTGATANCAPFDIAIGGGDDTDAVGASPLELNSDEVSELAVSHPDNPKAIQPAKSANAKGFVFCQAAAVSKVVTLTLPR
jgi:hypothetical protein